MKDIVGYGRVSAVYPERRTVKIKRDDTDTVTAELIILDRGDNWIPTEGQHVACIFSNGNSKGFVIGGI